MKTKKRALVKMYRWDDLVRLAVLDTREQLGCTDDADAEIYYIGGLDVSHNPFIRIDLTPLPGISKFKP